MEKRLGDLRLCWSYLVLNRAMGSVSRRKRIVILLQFTVWNSFIKFLISKTGYEFHKCQAKWIYIKSALNYQNLKIHVPRFATWGWRLASCSPVLGAKASGLRVVMFEWQVYVCMYVCIYVCNVWMASGSDISCSFFFENSPGTWSCNYYVIFQWSPHGGRLFKKIQGQCFVL